MSEPHNGTVRPRDNSGAEVPAINIHPKLMTNRNISSTPTPAHRNTPHSEGSMAVTVPTNAELVEAGVSAQDGVVRQLSARKQGSEMLAAPRTFSSSSNGRQTLAAVVASNGIGKPLQLSEARQPGESAGTPRSKQHHQPARHTPYGGRSRPSLGNSHEPIRPGRNGGHSPLHSPSKHNDPYGHVSSVVRSYVNNNISALETQYKNARSHSNANVPQTRDPAEYRSVSQQLEGDAEANAVNHAAAHQPRSARQSSPQPRHIAAEYLRGGVPRVALDAPHIKYAEALERMHNMRDSPRSSRAYSPSLSTAPTAFLPQVARVIPDRYKYVEPSESEKRSHKEETLRLLQEWRERQQARSFSMSKGREGSLDPPQQGGAKSGKRAASKKRAPSRSQEPLLEHSAPTRKPVPAPLRGEEKPEWDNRFEPGFGPPPPSPRTGSRTPRSARSGRRGDGALRASSRKGRKSRGTSSPSTARGETTVNQNAFRRRLLFDTTAPVLYVA
ncbi:hypothetical protein ABL78_2458 [Leptomonas seymouri]|uniref:Uncharacterized protein n=1 Tax=Leptomonas seymouri TaxID=5684 RepID=A0A0N1I0U4_LEPSE|nr:hypothetical protein ABL78_2458 [Leptomonas seymouri]|eukprot:KPI88445.1 hypothetical protein ABL78_2458 [Leptomonas seymouri]